MLKITPEQLANVKAQMKEQQKRSHFVIIGMLDPKTNEPVRMVTDYQSYLKTQKDHQPVKLVRDIVPITDNVAMWAITENEVATAQNEKESMELLKEIDFYINQILKDNKLPSNP